MDDLHDNEYESSMGDDLPNGYEHSGYDPGDRTLDM